VVGLMANTVAGSPLSYSRIVSRRPEKVDCPKGKEVAVRNTGMSTLWISFDQKVYFDVASGTSFDVRAEADHFWVRTKVGTTSVVVLVTT
jgi:hypothetical protein